MPGGAIDAIAAGALTGVSRIFALHCDPRLAVGQGRGASRADHVGGRPGRGHAALAGRAHLASASDRRPGVRARHVDHRRARRAVAAHRPAQQHGDGVGRGQCRRGRQRDPADRHAGRHHPHGQPRHLADVGIDCPRDRLRRCWRRWASSTRLQYRRGVPPVVNEEISTRILTHAIEAIGPDVLADTRQSGGGEDFSWYLEEVPGAMAGWASGPAAGRNWTCTSRRSTSTSGRSRSACGCWSTPSSSPPPSDALSLRARAANSHLLALCAESAKS